MNLEYWIAIFTVIVLVIAAIIEMAQRYVEHCRNRKRIEALIREYFPFEPLPRGRHRLDKDHDDHHDHHSHRAFT